MRNNQQSFLIKFLNLSRLGPCGSSILTDVGLSPVLVIQVMLEIRPRHLLLDSIFSIPQSAADVSRLDHLTPREGIDPCAQDYRPEACSGRSCRSRPSGSARVARVQAMSR